MEKKELHHCTIQIVNKECESLKIVKELGLRNCELIDIRSLSKGKTRHLIKIDPKDKEKIPDEESYIPKKDNFFWYDSKGCGLCKTIIENDSFLITARKTVGYTIIFDFVTPSFLAFRSIISELEEKGFKPKIIEFTKLTSMGFLTERQDNVLWLALKAGFFEFPRKENLKELSVKLGVAPSTISEILRRGTRKVLEYYFAEKKGI